MKAQSLSKWLTYSILLLNDLAEIWVQGCLIPKMRFDSLLSSSSKFLIRIAFSALAMPQTTHFTCCKKFFFLDFLHQESSLFCLHSSSMETLVLILNASLFGKHKLRLHYCSELQTIFLPPNSHHSWNKPDILKLL